VARRLRSLPSLLETECQSSSRWRLSYRLGWRFTVFPLLGFIGAGNRPSPGKRDLSPFLSFANPPQAREHWLAAREPSYLLPATFMSCSPCRTGVLSSEPARALVLCACRFAKSADLFFSSSSMRLSPATIPVSACVNHRQHLDAFPGSCGSFGSIVDILRNAIYWGATFHHGCFFASGSRHGFEPGFIGLV